MIDEREEYCDTGYENLIHHKDHFQYQKQIHLNKLNLSYIMNDSIRSKQESFDMMIETTFPLQLLCITETNYEYLWNYKHVPHRHQKCADNLAESLLAIVGNTSSIL